MKDRVEELQKQYEANQKTLKTIPRKINQLQQQIERLRNKITRFECQRDQLEEINDIIEREAAAVMLLQACETRSYWLKEESDLIDNALADAREFMQREFTRRKLEKEIVDHGEKI